MRQSIWVVDKSGGEVHINVIIMGMSFQVLWSTHLHETLMQKPELVQGQDNRRTTNNYILKGRSHKKNCSLGHSLGLNGTESFHWWWYTHNRSLVETAIFEVKTSHLSPHAFLTSELQHDPQPPKNRLQFPKGRLQRYHLQWPAKWEKAAWIPAWSNRKSSCFANGLVNVDVLEAAETWAGHAWVWILGPSL